MKIFKVVLFTNDEEVQDPKEIESLIENQKYPNWSLNPVVVSVEGVEIGEWDDNNPLNMGDTQKQEFFRLFPDDEWISVDDRLPKDGEYVLAYYNGGNWTHNGSSDGQQNICKCVFRKGKTLEENTEKRWGFEDEGFNNKKPYAWKGEGHLTLFGQDVSYWKPLGSIPAVKE